MSYRQRTLLNLQMLPDRIVSNKESLMKFFRSMIRSVVSGAIIVLAVSIADAQQPARQPTRRVQGEPATATPQLDQQTGRFRIDRRVIRPGLRLLPQRPAPRWRLGIEVDDAPQGLRISEVSRNSPAFRFGLERGDYLLDVMGFPVGLHRGAYFPLADALNQNVRRDGWVNVLVWNRRTRAEEALWIQAEPRSAVQRPTRPIPPRR
jgi:predicted metalloprotease with PDZ domain